MPPRYLLALCNFTFCAWQLGDVTLPAIGVYTVMIDDQNESIGDFALTLNSFTEEIQQVADDQTVIGILSLISDQQD